MACTGTIHLLDIIVLFRTQIRIRAYKFLLFWALLSQLNSNHNYFYAACRSPTKGIGLSFLQLYKKYLFLGMISKYNFTKDNFQLVPHILPACIVSLVIIWTSVSLHTGFPSGSFCFTSCLSKTLGGYLRHKVPRREKLTVTSNI